MKDYIISIRMGITGGEAKYIIDVEMEEWT